MAFPAAAVAAARAQPASAAGASSGRNAMAVTQPRHAAPSAPAAVLGEHNGPRLAAAGAGSAQCGTAGAGAASAPAGGYVRPWDAEREQAATTACDRGGAGAAQAAKQRVLARFDDSQARAMCMASPATTLVLVWCALHRETQTCAIVCKAVLAPSRCFMQAVARNCAHVRADLRSMGLSGAVPHRSEVLSQTWKPGADGVRSHRAAGQARAARRPDRPPAGRRRAPAPRCALATLLGSRAGQASTS